MSKNHLSTLPYLHISNLNINDKFDPIMEARLSFTKGNYSQSCHIKLAVK